MGRDISQSHLSRSICHSVYVENRDNQINNSPEMVQIWFGKMFLLKYHPKSMTGYCSQITSWIAQATELVTDQSEVKVWKQLVKQNRLQRLLCSWCGHQGDKAVLWSSLFFCWLCQWKTLWERACMRLSTAERREGGWLREGRARLHWGNSYCSGHLRSLQGRVEYYSWLITNE